MTSLLKEKIIMSFSSFMKTILIFLLFSACTEPVNSSDMSSDRSSCSDNQNCGVCEFHTDCESQVCDTGGTCMAAENIIYVSVDGANYEGCGSASEPCSRFDVALDLVDSMRTQLVIDEGRYNQRLVIGEKHVAVLGAGEVVLEPTLQAGESSVYVEGMGKLSVENVSLVGPALVTENTIGVLCRANLGGNNRPQVTLKSVRVEKFRIGVSGRSCKSLRLLESFVESNDREGIEIIETTNTEIERSFVALNGDGIEIVDSGYRVLNSFIVKNTGQGVLLRNSDSKVQGLFAFNTVAHNLGINSGDYSGVDCLGEMATLQNSIIVGEDLSKSVVSGTCSVDGVLAHSSVHGDNPVFGDPLFVDPLNMDFSLQASSPAIDSGSNDPAPRFDFDGELRPKGVAYDIGADEAR